MRRTWARAVSALALAAGLAAFARGMEPERIRGHYTVQFEEQSFQPCGSREKWWVSDPGPLMRRYREAMGDHGDYGTVYVDGTAEVSGRGRFGHLGMFPRTLAVREVREVRRAGENDCRANGMEVE